MPAAPVHCRRTGVVLHDLQQEPGIEAAQIVWVARDHALVVRASANDDARVDHIAATAPSEEQPHHQRRPLIQGNDTCLRMLEQPPQAHLPTAITERLRRDPGGNVDNRIGHLADPLDQHIDNLVAPFECDQ